jgi:CRISPR-associated endonuclease/helicase Cas3
MGEAEGAKLPDFSVQWTDGTPEEKRLARWASEQPKRYAAAAFAVGTIDQALLGVLRVKHAHLRAACLVRHLLVVDEVHASDPYMRWLVERLVGLFRACGGQVLLMSATLGAGLRTLLIDGPRVRIPARDDATRLPYPLISGAPGGPRPVAPEGRAKAVEIALLPLIDEPSAVAARAAEAAGEGARVLVLRNTVAAAIATQEALEALLPAGDPALFRVGETVTMHHGRFAAEDRRLLDKAIEERFGKGSTRRPGVVVATQTVEQSLDVDFDLLVTDLCPIDILLQRIGRLHRHPGPRPTGFEVARCLILGPEGGDLSPYLHATRHGIGLTRKGEARAYPDVRAVEATRQLIGAGARWTIPADNRRLVEEGTHPGALDAIAADFKGAWERHGGAVLGNIISQGSLARDNAIDFRRVFGEVGFGHGVEGALKTRLGFDDLLLPLDRPLVSPFGQTLARMRLPGWMIRKETWEAIGGQDEPTIAVGEDGGLALDGQRFVYDRLGLRPWVGP